MSGAAKGRRGRREARRQRWQSQRDTSESAWGKSWYRFREAFSILPHPSLLTAEENEGAVSMGAIRIPALIVYFPIYYILLVTTAIIVFPPLFLFTLIAG